MLFNPIENRGKLMTDWIQVRPRVTQGFGGDFLWHGKYFYKSMGLKGHNGIDLESRDVWGNIVAVPVFAPLTGELIIKDSESGYGLHVKLRSSYGQEVVIGHLSEVDQSLHGKVVFMGDYIGKTGSTGSSTAAHLHFGYRNIIPQDGVSIWKWKVRDYDNGFLGYKDILPFIRTWKGGYEDFNISDNH